jgi:hypothetical protein
MVMGFKRLAGGLLRLDCRVQAHTAHWYQCLLPGCCILLALTGAQAQAASKDDTTGEPISLSTESAQRGSQSAIACRPVTSANDVVTDAQQRLETIGCRLAFWVDGIGGGTASVAAARRTKGGLRFTISYSKQSELDLKLKGRIDAELPFLQRRVKAFIGREDTSEVDKKFVDSSGNLFSDRTAKSEWLVGLGFRIPRFKRIDTNVRIGLRSPNLPKVYAQANAEVILRDTSISLGSLFGKPFWTNRDGFGLALQGIYSRAVTARRYNFIRATQVLRVTEETEGTEWRSRLSLFQRINERTGLVWAGYAAGATQASASLQVYGASVSYYRPTGRVTSQWTLSYEFPRESIEKRRDRSIGLALELSLPFGQ